jgi:hypothetical protein
MPRALARQSIVKLKVNDNDKEKQIN